MQNAYVSTSGGVQACFDLSEPEIAAVAHAANVSRTERFRNEELSADDVVRHFDAQVADVTDPA